VACKAAWYCNDDCKVVHLPQHKEACREAVELMLFQLPPLREDCPICMIPLPHDENQSIFITCCGAVICAGCTLAFAQEELRNGKSGAEVGRCPFCKQRRKCSAT
jgi:hypothetical protein